MKKGSYWIRKAQDHDHSRGTLSVPSARNESVSQYHKLEKKLNINLSRMGELEDQLKRTIVKTRRCRIQEKIRNLRKLIKKTKTELENVSDLKDRPDDECATHPYSKQIRQGEIRKAYALSRFYGYIQKCLKSWSDMHVQSKRLTEPVLPQDSSSSSTPIDCELVGENGCIWSKDVHYVSKSQSQMSDVIRTSCDKYSSMVAKSVIAHDQGSNKESSIPSSSPSIIPCPEATSLTVLSVNDEVNESMNTAVQEEEESEEEDNYEVDDDVLARECALLVEGVSDDDDEYVYVPEECSHTTTTIADGNGNGNGNVINNSVNNNNRNATSNQDSLHDSSANTITAITTTSMSVEEDQPIYPSPNIALPSLSINDNDNDNDNNACNSNANKDVQESANKDAEQEKEG